MPLLRRASSSPSVGRSSRASPYTNTNRNRNRSNTGDENGGGRRVSQSSTRRVLADLVIPQLRSASSSATMNPELLTAEGIPLSDTAEPLDNSPPDPVSAQMEALTLAPQTPLRRRQRGGISSMESTPESAESTPPFFDGVPFTQPLFNPPPPTRTRTRRGLARASTAPSSLFATAEELSRFGDFGL